MRVEREDMGRDLKPARDRGLYFGPVLGLDLPAPIGQFTAAL